MMKNLSSVARRWLDLANDGVLLKLLRMPHAARRTKGDAEMHIETGRATGVATKEVRVNDHRRS